MIEKGRKRKEISDNNNYIGKYGRITHVCPECGNIYQVSCKLNVYAEIDDRLCLNGYTVSTPEIKKTCNCGGKTMQVDNAMGLIAKNLIDKKYTVLSCCEGHAYVVDYMPCYTFPVITLQGDVRNLIPDQFKSSLLVYNDFDKTVITCKTNCVENSDCPCKSVDVFDKFKEESLSLMMNMVNAMPIFSFNTGTGNTGSGIPVCSCSCEAMCMCD